MLARKIVAASHLLRCWCRKRMLACTHAHTHTRTHATERPSLARSPVHYSTTRRSATRRALPPAVRLLARCNAMHRRPLRWQKQCWRRQRALSLSGERRKIRLAHTHTHTHDVWSSAHSRGRSSVVSRVKCWRRQQPFGKRNSVVQCSKVQRQQQQQQLWPQVQVQVRNFVRRSRPPPPPHELISESNSDGVS